MSEKEIAKTDSKTDVQAQIEQGFEWISRADMNAHTYEPLQDRANTIQSALEKNRHLNYDEKTGDISVSNKPPEDGEQARHFSDLQIYLNGITEPINARMNQAALLNSVGDVTGAEKLMSRASELSRDLPTDLIQRQMVSTAEALKSVPQAALPGYEQHFLFLADPDSGINNLAERTHKVELQHYLGASPVIKFDDKGAITGVADFRFGVDQRFDPEKAFEIAQKLRELSIKQNGTDPLAVGDKEASQIIPSRYSTIDFDNNNLYAITERLSGRRFEGTGKLSTSEFAEGGLQIFNALDGNGDKVLDQKELREWLAKPELNSEQKQVVGTMLDAMPTIMEMSRAGGDKGLAKEDLEAFLQESKNTAERLEKIKDARSRLLFNNDFGAADANGNGYMTSAELKSYVERQSPTFSDSELKSFKDLQNQYSNISKSWWGMMKSDLVDLRPNSVKRVESSLWKNYYDSRAAQPQPQR